MSRIGLFLLFLTLSFFTNAQHATDRCGETYTIKTFEDVYGKGSYQQLTQVEENQPNFSSTGAEGTVHTIPVVVHIMYNNAESNISRQQVLDAIKILNRDYRRMNADTVDTRSMFKSDAADTEIEFTLAKKDPQGNCTEGITRTFTNLTDNAYNNVKPLINWPNNRYLNIWVVSNISIGGSGQTVLGYSYLPVFGGNNYLFDGIVIRHDQMGSIGTATNIGRTLVHEAGHYLGLNHPFNDGCSNNGDGFTDTPPVASASFGCDLNKNSCPADSRPDQIENYMDYADDVCTNMFTNQQAARMRNRLTSNNYRGNLISTTNQNFTGITPNMPLPCAPMADFEIENALVCAGDMVQFNDLTFMGNPTSYNWSFPGGSPSTSTNANPTVLYSQPGSYTASLTTTNASGATSEIKVKAVSVRSQNYTPFVRSMFEDFEQTTVPGNNWHITQGIDTIRFRTTNAASYSGTTSATLQNFYAVRYSSSRADGSKNELITNAIDLKFTTDATLTYKYAFAQVANNNRDVLKIYVSDDCGQTWNYAGQRLGPFLKTTNTLHTTSWAPASTAEWREGTVNLTSYANSPTYIMVKFEFESGGGNNFYLDDINIAATLGEDELETRNKLKVYPNPASTRINISGLEPSSDVQLTDVSGRLMHQAISTENEMKLDISALAKGMYILQVHHGNSTTSQKIIIQ